MPGKDKMTEIPLKEENIMDIKGSSFSGQPDWIQNFNYLKEQVKDASAALMKVDDVAQIDMIPGKGEVMTRKLTDATGLRGPETMHLHTEKLSYDPDTKDVKSYRDDVQRIAEDGNMKTFTTEFSKGPEGETYKNLNLEIDGNAHSTKLTSAYHLSNDGTLKFTKDFNGYVVFEDQTKLK
jgi:hypothetical protein